MSVNISSLYIYCIKILYEYDYRSNLYTNHLFATMNTFAKQIAKYPHEKIAREDNLIREDETIWWEETNENIEKAEVLNQNVIKWENLIDWNFLAFVSSWKFCLVSFSLIKLSRFPSSNCPVPPYQIVLSSNLLARVFCKLLCISIQRSEQAISIKITTITVFV